MKNDLLISERGNGGELSKTATDLVMTDNIANQIYLSLFTTDSGDYWANDIFPVVSSATQKTLNSVVLNSEGKQLIERAVKQDLAWLEPDYKLKSVITQQNRIDISIIINGAVYTWTWDKTKEATRVLPTTYPMRVTVANTDAISRGVFVITTQYITSNVTVAAGASSTLYTGVCLSTGVQVFYTIDNNTAFDAIIDVMFSSNNGSTWATLFTENVAAMDSMTRAPGTVEAPGANNILKFVFNPITDAILLEDESGYLLRENGAMIKIE